MSLCDLEVGKSARITNIQAGNAIMQKLVDMGFIVGENVEVVRNAPLQDPIEVQISSYLISIRREEASCVAIERA